MGEAMDKSLNGMPIRNSKTITNNKRNNNKYISGIYGNELSIRNRKMDFFRWNKNNGK